MPTGIYTRRLVPLADRFWSKVKKTESCWLWTASIVHGYGQIDGGLPQPLRAHRVSWEIHNGLIPDGVCVLHRCNVRSCVNPDHLYLGSYYDNAQDRIAAGTALNGRIGGEDHYRTLLTEEMVTAIRSLYADGGISHAEIGKRYGLTRSGVGRIVRRENWKYLETTQVGDGVASQVRD